MGVRKRGGVTMILLQGVHPFESSLGGEGQEMFTSFFVLFSECQNLLNSH